MRIIAFLSYRLAHIFTPGLGPFNVCMHCLGVSWALDLGACFFTLSFPITTPLHFHLILLVMFLSSSLSYLLLVCFIFLFTLSGDPPSVHHMEDSHIISTIYLADTSLEILSLRRSSRQREFVCYLSTWECVYLLLMIWDSFVHVQGTRICIYVKKNSACVYVHSVLDHWVCILMFGGHFYRVCSLLGVRMWAIWDPMLFVLLCHIYLWERWVTFS